MACQSCNQQPATVFVTDLQLEPGAAPGAIGKPVLRRLCASCAAQADLPHGPAVDQGKGVLFKLLQKTAKRSRESAGQACPRCGMTLHEFRAQGRLGCQDCYTTFAQHLGPLLLRMHQATQHKGRSPGVDPAELELRQRTDALREAMEVAIREEDYEQAASLRDRLEALEREAQTPEEEGSEHP